MPPGRDHEDAPSADPPPPTEATRALRASVLGVALGVALAWLGRRRRYSR